MLKKNKENNAPLNNNLYEIPQSLAEKIIRVSNAKKEFDNRKKISQNENCQAYREWGNAGYSIYNDRG